jgi:hypothetical protein
VNPRTSIHQVSNSFATDHYRFFPRPTTARKITLQRVAIIHSIGKQKKLMRSNENEINYTDTGGSRSLSGHDKNFLIYGFRSTTRQQ